ncbi:MAG TPA: hypothetical protein VD794_05150 [Flavisolibacter sp.]|nr:hypothetical protein [Flavisolibacter sp.]
MVKTLMLYLLLALPLFSIGQITLTSLNVNHPDSNVVFIGLDNYLKIGGIDSGKNIQLSTTKASASVSKVSADKFLIRVSTVGETPFDIYDYSTPTKKLLLSKSFSAQVLPGPEVRLGNAANSKLTIQEILTNPSLQVYLPHSSYQHAFTTSSFKLLIKNALGATLHIFDFTTGIKLTREQLQIIQGLSKGDQLLFTQLTATCPGCNNFNLPPYSVFIK